MYIEDEKIAISQLGQFRPSPDLRQNRKVNRYKNKNSQTHFSRQREDRELKIKQALPSQDCFSCRNDVMHSPYH